MYDNYPPGAANDPNAPYNQPPSADEMFSEEAYDKLEDEIDNYDDRFIEYIFEEGLIPDSDVVEKQIMSKETYDKLIASLSDDKNVRKAYVDKYYERTVDELYDDYCDRNSYEPDECDYDYDDYDRDI